MDKFGFLSLGLRMRMPVLLCALFLCSFCSAAWAGTLNTELDREAIIDGESIVLYIEGKDLSSTPDTAPLLSDFEIIQSGVSQSSSIVGGKRTTGYQIRLELKPKRLGKLRIPELSVGDVSSSPLIVEVVARGTPGVEPRDNVFAEMSVKNNEPYVQQQVVVEIKVYDDGKLAAVDPLLEGNSIMQVERLPAAEQALVDRDGKRYRVNTYRFALFPQISGELEIESITIPATIRDKDYGGGLILRNVPTRRIELRSNSVLLNVKPRPAQADSSWWLPLTSLEVDHQWSDKLDTVKVGDAVTLSLAMFARGAVGNQLPEFEIPDVDGLKIYADAPVQDTNVEQENVVALRREKWSVIPQRPGQFTLPEIAVSWWDTTTDESQRAVIPAQTINVAGGVSDASGQSNANGLSDERGDNETGDEISEVTAGVVNEKLAQPADDDEETKLGPQANDFSARAGSARVGHGFLQSVGFSGHKTLWQWLAIAALAAWFFTLLAWWLSSRAKRNTAAGGLDSAASSTPSDTVVWRELSGLSHGQDHAGYSQSMLRWANSYWRDQPVHNLPAIGRRLGDSELTKYLRQLDRARYSDQHADQRPGHHANNSQTVSLPKVQECLKNAVKNNRHASTPAPQPLPQL